MAGNYPQELLYTQEHEWCRIDGDVATVGITWHAQDALGDVVFCELPEVGREIKQSAVFGVVESVKAVSDLYTPLSGTVTERNDEVVKSPEILNQDCYEKGWMIRVRLKDKKELEKLLSSKDYVALLERAEG